MYKKGYLLLLISLFNVSIFAHGIKGTVVDENNEPLVGATVFIKSLNRATFTDEDGSFAIKKIPAGNYSLLISFVGYKNKTEEVVIPREDRVIQVSITLQPGSELSEVEVFGDRYKQPEKLETITRMPLRPSEQIQSISVISEKLIAEQGALTVTDVARNVPGVTLFGSYGGIRESMSIRGYRGVPVLKNGVGMDSDFRTASMVTDMQGVESVQVIKGSAAITQGIGNGLGSPGGVINIVTKVPKFVNAGEVGVRVGSWGQFRPTFDVQNTLDKNKTVAFRLNGAYERADGYRKVTASDRVYLNPSLAWRPDSKTTVTLEYDYLNENKTPDRGTVNLAAEDIEALYDMPKDRFLGYSSDNANTEVSTLSARVVRDVTDNIYVRAAYISSQYQLDQTGATLSTIKNEELTKRSRSLARSGRDDRNSTIQLDLIGRDLMTGSIKHTFQVGFDYRQTKLTQTSYSLKSQRFLGDGSYNSKVQTVDSIIDIIDVTGAINNTLPTGAKASFVETGKTYSTESNYGLMAQEVLTVNKYAKAILGVRYSYSVSNSGTSAGKTTGDAWDPMFGLMLTPIEHINVFGSYTQTTSLRSAAQLKEDGSPVGASRSKQWEVGIKSDWLNNRLRFNFTYFNILNSNTSYAVYDATGKSPEYYGNAGDLRRDGIEVELAGRILPNLQVLAGYSYTNPRYKNSPAFKEGSAPINTTKHTANGWLNYAFEDGFLKGLFVGAGVYYVGARPSNDYTIKVNVSHNTTENVKPFDFSSYTTVNAQLGYKYDKFTTRVFFNNIFDELGYNSYFRGGYINQIDPRNFAASVTYSF